MSIVIKYPFLSCAVVEITGSLLGRDAGDILARGARELQVRGFRRLILDLRFMDGVDFAGICLLRELVAGWRAAGGVVGAVGPSESLDPAIAVFKLADIVGDFYPSVEAVFETWLDSALAA